MAGPPSKKGRYHGDLANADTETGRVYVWDANRSAWRLTTTEGAVEFSAHTKHTTHQKRIKQGGDSASSVEITNGGILVNGQFASTEQILAIAADIPGLSVVGTPQFFRGPKGKNGITPRLVVKTTDTDFSISSNVFSVSKSSAITIIGAQFLGGSSPPSILAPDPTLFVVNETASTWDINSFGGFGFGVSGAKIYCLSLE